MAETPKGDRTAETVRGLVSRLSGFVADALRYWEPRRVFYNAVLAAVVGAHAIADWPVWRQRLSVNTVLAMFLLAVLANVAYCAVYAVDLFVQFSGMHAAWRRGRVAVLIVGTAFAAIITHFIVQEGL